MANIWAKKPLDLLLAECQETGEHTPEPDIGRFSTYGSGRGRNHRRRNFCYVRAWSAFAGPGLMLSFVLSGLGCAFAGLCYAEFAAMIPWRAALTPMLMPRWVNFLPGSSVGI